MSQSYGITIISSLLKATMFKQYLILPVQTTILKLLPLVPSIESFKKSGEHYNNTCNSEMVGATN